MQINSDYRDLLSRFNETGVRYLIVGGYAVMKYTEPFYTPRQAFFSKSVSRQFEST